MPLTNSIKREAALFDFFKEFEAEGSPRVAGFWYYKTDGTPGEKLNCSRSYETVTMAIQALGQNKPEQKQKGTLRSIYNKTT